MNGIVALKKANKYTDLAQLGLASISVSGMDIILTKSDGTTSTVSVPTPKDGVSIVSVEVNVDNTLTCTLSDGTKVTTTNKINTIKGDRGDDGRTPQFTIGTVTTVDSTQSANANITGTSANPVLNLTIPKGKDGSTGTSTDEKVKLTSSSVDAHYLEDLIDNSTIDIDTVNNCLVVKRIDGLNATVAEINFLSGITSNVQEQINNLGKSMTMYGVFDTKADLLAATTPAPVDGNTAIVVADETNDGKQMTYIYIASSSSWTKVAESTVLVRDFTTNPIDLSSEVTGTLPKDKIDTAIARLSDVLDKNTYKGSADGVVKSADTLKDLTHTLDELNDAIDKSHEHLNKTVLDNIISNGLGNRLLSDNGTYKEFLVLSSTAPTDTYCIWVDTTLSSTPILKVNDGINWIAVSGATSGKAGESAYEIAVDNGFIGTETEWLDSLKGADGITPHIDQTTNNWFIDTIDTGVSAKGVDGRSIQSITKDSSDNIVVTFSDGTTQNIGKLSVDVQGDFLTSDGFGNLRYYNGVLQYYDKSTSAWVDTSVTPTNVYILNMAPQSMRKMTGKYDVALGKYKLQWDEPKDTIIDGQASVIVEKVIIRRKLGSMPTDETDGDLVIEVSRKDFHSHKNSYYIDNDCSPNDGEIYYYKAFPISTTGFVNKDSYNEVQILCKDYYLYGFKLDQNESDPASMITYLQDCDNATFTSVYMDYSSGTFNYGDWEDAWFIHDLKPCMLKYDGTVDYELDPNDYTKKLDGTASDIANDSYGGNAMVGIPKVYWKIVDNGDNTANVYFSDKQVDTNFHCWSHIDNNGNEIDYCYMPIYNGSNVNSKLRSLSGKAPMVSQTATTEITYAKANNLTSDIIWYTEVFSDRMLINLLLLLIGKSTDTQTVFGTGNNNSYVSASNTGIKNTGTMNTKGLFWGNQDNKSGVKVFGIENWYGNIWRRIGGWINDKGTQKIKMTYGQSDGSTTDGYNETGSGYITIGGATPSGTNGGYISKMIVSNNCLIPTVASGSATTYYCDGLWFNNSQVDYAFVGGASGSTSPVGALCSNLIGALSLVGWALGAALSCKPLASTT